MEESSLELKCSFVDTALTRKRQAQDSSVPGQMDLLFFLNELLIFKD